MKNKKFLILVLSTLFICGCTNPFQKTVVVVGKDSVSTDKNEVDSEINENSNEVEIESTQDEESYYDIIDNNEEESKEEEIIDHFSEIEDETNTLLKDSDDSTIRQKVVGSFVNIIDFIFYDKEIKGVKFDSLKDSTKNKILDIADRMDKAIEKKIPGYKDRIKTSSSRTYNKISEKLSETKEKILEKTEELIGEDNYNNLQDNYEDLKDSAKSTGGKIRDGISNIKDKIKNWYEEKTGKK